MNEAEAIVLKRQFRKDVEAESQEADARFPQMQTETLDVWLNVLTEEVGKLARAVNKLHLAQDAEVVAHWQAEGRRRMVTSAAIIDRLTRRWAQQ